MQSYMRVRKFFQNFLQNSDGLRPKFLLIGPKFVKYFLFIDGLFCVSGGELGIREQFFERLCN